MAERAWRSGTQAVGVTLRLPPPVPDVDTGCVFSTLRVVDGRPVLWPEHRRRLAASAAQLHGADLPPDLERRVASAASAASSARMRVRLTVATGSALAAEVELTHPPPQDDAPRRLVTVVGRTGSWAHKWCDRRQLTAAAELAGPGRHPLFAAADGHLLETATANLLMVDEASLLTPPCDGSVLPGVTRALAVVAAAALGLRVVERPVTPADAAGRALVTASSLAGVVPVASVDGVPARQLSELVEQLRQRVGAAR